MYCWYIARNDELMVDIDHYNSNAPPTKLVSARSRLAGSIKSKKIAVDSAWLYPSDRDLHYHLIIKLSEPMHPMERHAWELYFRGDPFRHMNNMMRTINNITSSLLITSEAYKGFYRLPDDTCNCSSKHSHVIMESCPAAKRIRGGHRAIDYFGKPCNPAGVVKFGRIDI